MNIDWITIHCSDWTGNKYPRIEKISDSTDNDVALSIETDSKNIGKITFFMTKQDMVNFKNSVVFEVDNYLKGVIR